MIAAQLSLFDLDERLNTATPDDVEPIPGECGSEAATTTFGGVRSLCRRWGEVWTNCRIVGHCTWWTAERGKK